MESHLDKDVATSGLRFIDLVEKVIGFFGAAGCAIGTILFFVGPIVLWLAPVQIKFPTNIAAAACIVLSLSAITIGGMLLYFNESILRQTDWTSPKAVLSALGALLVMAFFAAVGALSDITHYLR